MEMCTTAPVAIRPDIQAAHEKIWRKLAEPGTWWTGAERGRQASPVLRALSLVPEEVRLSILTLLPAQYMDPFRVRDPEYDPGRAIDRAQIELLASRVSVLNQCFY